jgi:hypothetical protein
LGGDGKKSVGRIRAINSRFRDQRPTGYLTPEDYTQREATFGRGAATAGKLASDASAGVRRRAAIRGISGGPAMERDLARVTQNQGAQDESAAARADAALYGTKMNREGFERDKLMYEWGSELGADMRDWQGQQAQDAQFWNSVIPLATEALGSLSGGGDFVTPERPGAYYPPY